MDTDGAPHAERRIAMWNPPLVDEALGRRGSALSEASMLLADLVQRDVRTICFLKSRRGVELIQRFTRERLEAAGRADLAERVAPYRAGYTPAQRRELERRLAEGDLLAVVATDALELGIDIGDLDAAICVTFPGTVASLRQMWGRAGRRAPGLAMYVAGEDALDQFFCRHPDEFLDRPVERAILDHESEEIFMAHLAAAAYEMPLTPEDEAVFGPRWETSARRLVGAGKLRERGGRYLPRGSGYPAGAIALRSASPDSVAIVEASGGELIGSVEASRSHSAVHPGAVYLHMGAAYEVEDLDLAEGRAVVTPFRGDWYTQPKKESQTYIEEVREQRLCCGVDLSFGVVSVSEQVVAYQRKNVTDHRVMDLLALDLPEQDFVTQALWYELPDSLLKRGVSARRPPGLAPRRGARADRGAPPPGHVRPLGHRRTLHGVPPPDGPGHNLHLRRPSRRRGHHPRGLRAVREPGGRRPPPDLRVPVPIRLPLLRAVTEVRQPERAAEQARRDRVAQPHDGLVAALRVAQPDR